MRRILFGTLAVAIMATATVSGVEAGAVNRSPPTIFAPPSVSGSIASAGDLTKVETGTDVAGKSIYICTYRMKYDSVTINVPNANGGCPNVIRSCGAMWCY